jgi:APA family basic amino acid/polyamine antiporter
VHATFRTPTNAIALQGVWTVMLLFIAHRVRDWRHEPSVTFVFDTLTDMVIFGGSVFYAMAVAAVFVLRRRHPEWERPYRAFGYPVTPILYLLMFAAALTALFWKDPARSLLGSLLIFAGIPVFYFWTNRTTHKNF